LGCSNRGGVVGGEKKGRQLKKNKEKKSEGWKTREAQMKTSCMDGEFSGQKRSRSAGGIF